MPSILLQSKPRIQASFSSGGCVGILNREIWGLTVVVTLTAWS